jgi:hypothetical protein
MNEELVKYLAGLIDADGSISFNFNNPNKDKSAYTLSLRIELASSDAVDFHGFIPSLPDLTKFGSVGRYGDKNQFTKWVVTSRSNLEMLVPRLVKHMVAKAKHLLRMFNKWKEKRGKLLSVVECDELRAFSKGSRYESGPLKPKNHPSWAWLAGYLDGNGCYRSARCKSGTYNGKQCYRWQASVQAACHIGDVGVLEFIQKAHGGYIKKHSNSENCMIWERSLGKRDRSFALSFLADLVSHSRLKKHKIEQLIAFHHQQRLSGQTPAGEATV